MLRAQGLTVTWDGTATERVAVGIAWRRRYGRPDPATATSTGRHVSLAEAERMLSILATQDRVAVSELPGVGTVAW